MEFHKYVTHVLVLDTRLQTDGGASDGRRIHLHNF